MKLLIQPHDGVEPLAKAIRKAKKSVEIVIFRFDRGEIEKAMVDAAERGVFVHALIAFTNRGGEERLRDLETEFLAKGITVARTSGDLVRYHGKMMIIDRRELYVLGYNFTHLDMDHSRSFGVVTRNPKLVQEAARLFEADTKRQEFESNYSRLVVSPVNARKQLGDFIAGARSELLIYDPKISDKQMMRRLRDRAEAGVKIRVIGAATKGVLPTRKPATRLHTRTIIRDRSTAFIGSQSLRALELDRRREIGIIIREGPAVAELRRVFEKDWAKATRVKVSKKAVKLPMKKAVKTMAKVMTKRIPLAPLAKHVEQAIRKNGKKKLGRKDVEKTVRVAMKQTVRQAMEKVAREAVEDVLEEVS